MLTEDLGQFFDADELGDLCVIGGVDVVGLFTAEGEDVEGVVGHVPILVAPLAAIPSVTTGTTVEAPKGSGTSYEVREVLPDPTGATVRLILEEVA